MTIENVINCEKCQHTIKICAVLNCTQQLTTVQLNVLNTQIRLIFFSSLILIRNGFVPAPSTWISIFKLIRKEYSRLHIKRVVKQTLQHSLSPLFFGTPCIFWRYKMLWFDWHNISTVLTVSYFEINIQKFPYDFGTLD